ncbi:CobW family GTP-binding protein [Salaquimonas pukyongi]|uniref:CobW family GTP-binding protein n=1 Tax=Salaquimonas pukyongi TaxID=2712698 RepID=UPI0013BE9EE5|nr:GTP-binding protein [Salaquimonas pukyongi]
MMSRSGIEPALGTPIPVLVLSGFLGSGKTTLLNAMLKLPALAGTAVVINEFGEVSLDHHLVQSADDGVIELTNGCLCCTVRGKLIDTLEALLTRDPAPAAIIIETTGLADPLPVLAAIMSAPKICDNLSLRGLFTVFDAAAGSDTLDRFDEARHQIMLADRIILSKTDLLNGPEGHKPAVDLLAAINPECTIQTPAELLDEIAACTSGSWLEETAPAARSAGQPDNHVHHHGHDINRHSERICCVTLRADKPVKRSQLDLFLELMLSAHGDHVLRIKGLVKVEGKEKPLLVQAAGSRLSSPEFLPAWPGDVEHTSLVVFLEDMDPGFVTDLFASATNRPLVDRADHQALADNPLAIDGLRLGNPK